MLTVANWLSLPRLARFGDSLDGRRIIIDRPFRPERRSLIRRGAVLPAWELPSSTVSGSVDSLHGV
jgi:hypothetical protein